MWAVERFLFVNLVLGFRLGPIDKMLPYNDCA